MDDNTLEALFKNLESDRAERKASGRFVDAIRRAICAFANDLPNHNEPGVVFVGENDDGSCAGLPITDQLLNELGGYGKDGTIHPFPAIVVQKRTISSCELAIIEVDPSKDTPVRYKGDVWVRIGPSTRTATPEQEGILSEKRRARDLPYDIRPVEAATIQDLDEQYFKERYLPFAVSKEVLEENVRSYEDQLISLRLASAYTPPAPTVLGLLTTGVDPVVYIPPAYIHFRRIDGNELTDPSKDEKQLSGPIGEILRLLDDVLKINISTATAVSNESEEIQQADYPLEALQQIARNAVLHRNYEGTNAPVRINWFVDRVEIGNPGGPYGQITKENFGKVPGLTDYRNPHLAEVLNNLKYVQKFGVGIPLAKKALEDNGNPPIEFVPEDTFVLATIRRR